MDVDIRSYLASWDEFKQNFRREFIKTGTALLVPGIVSIVLWVWYFHGQRAMPRACIGLCDPLYLFEFDGVLGRIERATSRTMSHLYHDHLYGNIVLFSIATYVVVYYQRTKQALSQLYLTFLAVVIIMSHYDDIVGFSGVAYGSVGLMLVTVLSTIIESRGSWRDNLGKLLPLGLLSLYLIPILQAIFPEFLVFTGYMSPHEFGIGDPVSDVSSVFTTTSIRVHVYGFVSGCLVALASIWFDQTTLNSGSETTADTD